MMHGQHQPLEQTPHLAPALTAVILGVVLMAAVGFYARSLEYRSIKALAADEAIIERNGKLAPVKNQGTALQQADLFMQPTCSTISPRGSRSSRWARRQRLA
jgi:hypothetical protein